MIVEGIFKKLFGTKKNKPELVDNHGKTCHPLNQRAEFGGRSMTIESYIGTCSLCGNNIRLYPCAEIKCSNCLATVDHS